MRTLALSSAVILMLCGCDDLARLSAQRNEASASSGPAATEARPSSGGFPHAGTYDIVRDTMGRREASNMWVDASNPEAFEMLVARPDGSNCRDRQVSIGGGSFTVRMTCDAPDGDIHNIAIQRSGSYSERSIQMTSETRFWSYTIRETASYQLRPS